MGGPAGLAIPRVDPKAPVWRGGDGDTLVVQAGKGVMQRGGVASGELLEIFSEEAIISADRVICIDVVAWSLEGIREGIDYLQLTAKCTFGPGQRLGEGGMKREYHCDQLNELGNSCH